MYAGTTTDESAEVTLLTKSEQMACASWEQPKDWQDPPWTSLGTGIKILQDTFKCEFHPRMQLLQL